MHIIDTKELDHGVTVKVVHDDDAGEAPYAGDDGVRIVVLHRNYIDPAKGACGKTGDEVTEWAEENAAEWFVANLYMYEHSGVAYRAGMSNPFGCPWDSGQVGIVALKRSEWGTGNLDDDQLLEYAKNVATEYGQWANGEVYGYIISTPDDDHADSCWGYVGDSDFAMSEGLSAAEYYVGEIVKTIDSENANGDGI
jgi:hypothetical protein